MISRLFARIAALFSSGEKPIGIGWTWETGWTGFNQSGNLTWETPMLMTVTRTRKSSDGIFGNLAIDGNAFKCVTLENLEKALAVGLWPLTYAYSPHFNRQMPLINVPGRTWTWFHWANFPIQLEGCIALGKTVDGDAIDDSVAVWNQFWGILNNQPGIMVNIVENYESV